MGNQDDIKNKETWENVEFFFKIPPIEYKVELHLYQLNNLVISNAEDA